jgi:hypothetical protein
MSPFLPQSLDTSLPALMQIFSSGWVLDRLFVVLP